MSAVPQSPYKGLAAFADTALDAQLFFGREREIEVIVANLMAARLTVLYGVSGVGKTSLLRAGVAHRIRQAHHAMVVVFSSWTGDPVGDLLDAIEAAAPDDVEPVRRTGSLADVLSAWTRRSTRRGTDSPSTLVETKNGPPTYDGSVHTAWM